MISLTTLVFIIVSIIITIFVPIILLVFFYKKNKLFVGVFIGGMVSFYVPQLIVRVPIIQLVLPQFDWYQRLSQNVIGLALFLGLSAALFETFGRYITLNFLLKKHWSYETGLVHGIGHGGIEAIMLVGLNYLIFALFIILQRQGVETPITFLIPLEQQELVTSLLKDTPSIMFLVAGIERFFTMILHVALSLLVTIGLYRKQVFRYLAIVLFIHSFVDVLAVILSGYGVSIVIIEATIGIIALLCCGIIYYGRHLIPSVELRDEAEDAVKEGY